MDSSTTAGDQGSADAPGVAALAQTEIEEASEEGASQQAAEQQTEQVDQQADS